MSTATSFYKEVGFAVVNAPPTSQHPLTFVTARRQLPRAGPALQSFKIQQYMSDELPRDPGGGDPRFPIKFKPRFHRIQGAQLIASYINMLYVSLASLVIIHSLTFLNSLYGVVFVSQIVG